MNKKTKWKVKTALSTLRYPVLSYSLLRQGSRNFYICPRLMINAVKYLSVGNYFYLGRDSRIHFISEYHGGRYQPMFIVGNNVDIGQRFTVLCAAPISIGDGALLASDILITSENHGIDPEELLSYAKQPLSAASVVIGDECWIGEKVSIMPGVTLGKKVIVAAHSVVTKSFPDYTMIAGVPAKVIKTYNFEKHEWERVDDY